VPTYEPHDKFYRKARAMGLPSRAAFKIEEILARNRLIPKNAKIVDLGCAPGGWLAILARAVGANGLVVGIDLAQCRALAPNVVTIAGDVRDATVRTEVAARLGGSADLITSDLSPKLTGIADRDQAQSAELLSIALEFAHGVLKPDGALIVKLFMNGEFSQTKANFARAFAKVEVTHTKASRPGSSELYLIARGFNPNHD
jgi:23S rRNA (uridine2552-2'-O)-methyltransferase